MRPKYGTPYLFTSANPILFFTRHLKTHYFISAHLAPALAASVMRPDSLPRLWRYMSLTYLLTYNTRQFITEFLNKDWTKNSINRHAGEVQNSRHSTDFWAAGGAGACWWKCQQLSRWLAVAESGRQKTSEPPSSQRNFKRGVPSLISFADYSQRSAICISRKAWRAYSWQTHSM